MMDTTQVLLPTEAEGYIQALEQFELKEIGSQKYENVIFTNVTLAMRCT